MERILTGEDAKRYLQENDIEKPNERVISGEEAKKYLEENYTEKPGYLKSAAIGGLQGVTGENAPEILSGIQSGAGAIGQEILGENDDGINLQQYDLLKKFKELKKKHRETAEEAKKENPFVYGGANLAGNIALSSAIPDGNLSKLSTPAFLQSFGESEKELTEDPYGLAKDTLVGGTVGTALGATIGKGVEKAGKVGKYIKNKVPEFAYDMPSGMGEKYYKLKNLLGGAKTKHELSKELSEKLPEIGKQASRSKGEAVEALRSGVGGIPAEQANTKEIAENVFDKAIKEIEKREQGLKTDSALQNTKKYLEDLRDEFSNLYKNIGRDRISDEIDTISKKINWAKNQGIPQNEKALKSVRSDLSQYLKENEEYLKHIGKSQEKTILSGEAKEKFGKEFKPKDVLSTVENIATGGKNDPILLESADRIGKSIGIDIKNESEMSYIKDAIKDSDIFSHGIPHFFKGITIQALPMTIMGASNFIDKNVSSKASKYVKNFSRFYEETTPEIAQTAITTMMDAARNGDKSAVLALQILKLKQEGK